MKIFSRKYSGACLALFLTAGLVSGQETQPITVPIQMINGLPYMEVKINGKGPYLFGFDTGFGAEVELDAGLAETLNIQASGQASVGDGSGRNEVNLDTANINRLQIGSYAVVNTPAILRTSARKNVPGMENVKGIIGMGLFNAHMITVNYPKLLFVIENGNLPKANNADILDYEEVGGGVPLVKIKVGGFELDAAIDSRSMSGSFKIPQETAGKLTFLSEPKLVGKGRTVSNTIDINEVRINESITIGNLDFKEPTITFPSLNAHAIIGAKLLQKFCLTIDSKNKRIRFTKGPEEKIDMQLAEYIGQFGDRKISAEGNFLYVQRPNGMLLKLLPKNPDEYTLEAVPGAILIFERDANRKIKSLKVSKGDGQWEIAEKTNS